MRTREKSHRIRERGVAHLRRLYCEYYLEDDALLGRVVRRVVRFFQTGSRCRIACVPIGLIFTVMLITGFVADVLFAINDRVSDVFSLSPDPHPFYSGPESVEEKIVSADVIARVRLRSVNKTVETHKPDEDEKRRVLALAYEFDVLEYLKGDGRPRLVGVVYEVKSLYNTTVGAWLFSENILANRDMRWDDREAIVFLRSDHPRLPSSSKPDRYWLRIVDDGWHMYDLDSVETKRWLPEVLRSAATSSEQRFLLSEPSRTFPHPAYYPEDGSLFASEAEAPSISLSELKNLISGLETEVAAGDGSEAYLNCVFLKYEWERQVQDMTERLGGAFHHFVERYDLGSGLPAGSHVYYAFYSAGLAERFGEADASIPGTIWIDGPDAEFFEVKCPRPATRYDR